MSSRPVTHELEAILSTSNFIMIASHLYLDDRVLRSEVVFETLVQRNAWYLSAVTPYRDEYASDDRLAFYLGGAGNRYFAGAAAVSSTPVPVSSDDVTVLKSLGIPWFDLRLPLKDISIWPTPRMMVALKEQLLFIKDKRNYGLYLRHGARRISDEDYHTIVES